MLIVGPESETRTETTSSLAAAAAARRQRVANTRCNAQSRSKMTINKLNGLSRPYVYLDDKLDESPQIITQIFSLKKRFACPVV